MTTIPSRLARTTFASGSIPQARARSLKLYREWYRAAPEIPVIYGLSITAPQIRAAIRGRFEKNRHVTDPRAIDVLLLKSRQEYQETMNAWKQPDHVLGLLVKVEQPDTKTWMERFYEGRDEKQVLPGASGI